MQSHYEAAFAREMGCTESELRSWLPGASAGAPLAWRERGVDVTLDSGRLTVDWQVLAPRRIALVVLPRLQVRFTFHGVDPAERHRFMRHFDLYTQRGGG